MNMSVSYLVRKLAIIKRDGQFLNYELAYVSAEKAYTDNGDECLANLKVSPFDMERAATTYLDSLTLRALPGGLWKMI